jgi:hypothetical protein
MKLRVTRSGGFAGVPLVAEVDLATLPAERAAAVREAVSEIDFAAKAPPAPPIPDGFHYRIDVWRDDGHVELTADDPFVPPPVRKLAQLLEHAGR